jgi:hypothetical protein
MALIRRIRSHNASQRSESARRRLRDRRGLKLAAVLLLASLVVLVPVADAALDPTDAVCSGTGMLTSESGGAYNTACGYNALNANTTGRENTAAGADALVSNTTGGNNTAAGAEALFVNTTGFNNTAAGAGALFVNTMGVGNTAAGAAALYSNTTGSENTAAGGGALVSNTTGNSNTALGNGAGVTANGANANTTGSNDTFLGVNAGPGTTTQLSNATAIGANALVSESKALVLGDSVNVGIGTATPQSLLQLGSPSTSYGNYLQLPMVSNSSPPPAAACDGKTFVGRLVLQFDATHAKTTLWSCSPAGKWTGLASGR